MKDFAELFHDLDNMTKTNDRLNRLIRYFEDSKPEDAIWVCWFLSGNRIKGAIKTGELRNFLARRTKLPVWLIEECHDRVGDLAETISLLAGSESESSSSGLDQIIRQFYFHSVEWIRMKGWNDWIGHGILCRWRKCSHFTNF